MHLRRAIAQTSRQWSWYLLLLMIIGVALVPWCRNHHYLRSFFDYGVVMGGVGRILDGQKPYVDFITPIQTGWYYFNGLADRLGGGTFQAMTLAGAACIICSTLGMFVVLAKRWSVGRAILLAGSLVFATASQHTLWWYNSWGVVLLCLVAWGSAVAPVLARRTIFWNSVVCGALYLGGINKINMQLMAMALGAGWAVRAGLMGKAGWLRILLTLITYGSCELLAVGTEMWLTGATWQQWWHNVIALPAMSRMDTVSAAVSVSFLFRPLHDYYGTLLLPQVGLVGVLATVVTVVAILRHTWKEPGVWGKVLPVICGLVALLGGMVLLTTNMDIAYIGLAGWLGLLVALWLGFGVNPNGGWFWGGLCLPVVVVGVVSWISAWEGQRSQFGHSLVDRSQYVAGEDSDADMGYLRGTLIPPEMGDSLRQMARWRRNLPKDRRGNILYGPGTEMAARFWPAMHTPGLPIYLHAGNSVGVNEGELLRGLIASKRVSAITVSRVLDLWGRLERALLEHRFEKIPLGGVFSVYEKVESGSASIAPVWFTRVVGGNTDARYLVSDAQMLPMSDDWRMMLGVTEGASEMQLTGPTNRLKGEVVLRRIGAGKEEPLQAEFAIYAQGNPTTRFERWRETVILPPGQSEILVPYSIDSSHLPTTFTVAVAPSSAKKVQAGWLGPYILDTGAIRFDEPSWFYRDKAQVQELPPDALERLMSPGWRPHRAVMRGGQVLDEGIELSPGGEIWLRVDDGVVRIEGNATLPATSSADDRDLGVVRGMWYGGKRLEVFTDQRVRSNDRRAEFHAWCAEPRGWLVIGVDPSLTASPVIVRITSAIRQ